MRKRPSAGKAKQLRTTRPEPARPEPARGIVSEISALLDPSVSPSPEQAARSRRIALLVLTATLAALLFPFLNIAFHIDDTMYMWAADHIRHDPGNPYAFTVNWYGTEMPMWDVTKNPPLSSYYAALAAIVVGWNEVVVHLAFLIPALAVAVGTYLVANRMCAHPLIAALTAVITPVFLVSSLTVMSDVLMFAFWMFAVLWWMDGLETKRHASFMFAAVLIALSALTKYFGMMLIPLLLAYSLAKQRRASLWLLYFLVPVGILAWYQWATHRLYGRGLLTDAASYASENQTVLGRFTMTKTVVALAFTGGCLAGVVFFSRRLWHWRALMSGLALAVVVMLMVASSNTIGTFKMPAADDARWLVSAQIGLWTAGGVGVVALAAMDLYRHRDADSLLLFLWILGTCSFAGFVNWTTNARSILPMVAPAGILVARRLESMALVPRSAASRGRAVLAPLTTAAIVSLAAVWGDYSLAGAQRAGAAIVRAQYWPKNGTVWFQGHWGFQFYMERLGAKPLRAPTTPIADGDLIVTPTTASGRMAMPSEWTIPRATIDLPSSRWVSTMNGYVGAGFYADEFGPLPFAVGFVPDEQLVIQEFHAGRQK